MAVTRSRARAQVASNLAHRIYRSKSEINRKKAAEVNQKHWRAALVKANGTPMLNRKIPRFRTVTHNGKVYSASAILNWDNTWPRTKNVITSRNRNLIRSRSQKVPGRRPLTNQKVNYFHRKLLSALAAYRKGPKAFAPYQRAGWKMETVQLVENQNGIRFTPYTKNNIKEYQIPIQTKWNNKAIQGALRKYFGSNNLHVHVSRWPTTFVRATRYTATTF